MNNRRSGQSLPEFALILIIMLLIVGSMLVLWQRQLPEVSKPIQPTAVATTAAKPPQGKPK